MNGKTTLSCWRTFFPTSYHATELAAVSPGKTVAVFGAGPVGLLAAYSALLKGAAEVYVVDNVAERLEKAKELGATCRFQPGRSSRADFRNSSKTSGNSAEPSSRRRKAAAEVYVVDNVAERLEKAKELGATCRFQPGRSSRADF